MRVGCKLECSNAVPTAHPDPTPLYTASESCSWDSSRAQFQRNFAPRGKVRESSFYTCYMLRAARWIVNTIDHSHGPRIHFSSNFTRKRHLSTNLTTTEAQKNTIYALSTPPGKGGVAIVRVSGPDALLVWDRMVRSHNPKQGMKTPIPWKMQRCRIVHPENESLIDDGLAVYFKGVFAAFESIY